MLNIDWATIIGSIFASLISGGLCGLITSLVVQYLNHNQEKKLFRLKELKNSLKTISELPFYAIGDFDPPVNATGLEEKHKIIVTLTHTIVPLIAHGLRIKLKDKIDKEKSLYNELQHQILRELPISKDGETPVVYAFEEEWMESYNSLRDELITTITTQIEKILNVKSEV